MSNIFANANTNVVPGYKAKTNARKIDIMSDTVAASQCLRAINAAEKEKEDEALLEASIEQDRKKLVSDRLAQRVINESKLDVTIGRMSKDIKTYLLKDILFEVYSKSLILDEDFVNEHSANISKVVSDYVDNNGGFTLIENAATSTGSNLLKKIKTVCEKTASTITCRKIKEAKECGDASCIKFDMIDSEQKDFDYNKSEISPDEIAELVKDKVLTVVKDEKNRQQNEDDIRAEIEEELTSSEDVTDEETAKEAVNRILANNISVEETTLFNALLRNRCNEVMIESTTRNFNSDMDVDTSVDDITSDGPIDDGDDTITPELDMDSVLAEALAQYTLMEMLYTMKIEDYKAENLRQLSVKLIQPIKTR